MQFVFGLFMSFIIVIIETNVIAINNYQNGGIRSRKKRYIAFPEGSTFVATLCPTIATVTGFGLYFQGINWGLAYTLPNRSSLQHYVAEKHKKRRRERRDLYSKIETIVDSMGFDGRACIYRALCEAPRKFKIKSGSISEQFLKILFKFPTQYLSDDEPDEHITYHSAYRNSVSRVEDCAEIFPRCTISLIDWALGHYEDIDEDT